MVVGYGYIRGEGAHLVRWHALPGGTQQLLFIEAERHRQRARELPAFHRGKDGGGSGRFLEAGRVELEGLVKVVQQLRVMPEDRGKGGRRGRVCRHKEGRGCLVVGREGAGEEEGEEEGWTLRWM